VTWPNKGTSQVRGQQKSVVKTALQGKVWVQGGKAGTQQAVVQFSEDGPKR
jgi:hypothetical protein